MGKICMVTASFEPYCLLNKGKAKCKLEPLTCGFSQTTQQWFDEHPQKEAFLAVTEKRGRN